MPLAIFFVVESGDMKRAALWAAIIVILSLFLILAVNYWSEAQLKIIGRRAK